jgi:DNA-binding CsgD family transcriptional regulator
MRGREPGIGERDLARRRRFWQRRTMWRTIFPYALALAVAAVGLEWLRYRHLTRLLPTEIYVGLIAFGFIALGLWLGRKLTPMPRRDEFIRNDAAIRSLGLSPRECEILEMLASGASNKELARALGISPNTVKTHVARVYEKLDVDRRISAVEEARRLALIP